MATVFTRRGNEYYIGNDVSSQQIKELPPANYVIKLGLIGYYFEVVDSFTLPPKVYGETERTVKRFLHTYKTRTSNTGILLAGEKGSGKTLAGKMTSIIGAEAGIPTLIVNTPFSGPEFNQLLQEITQPCIVFFDEFEKVYPKEKQEPLLTLLDGVFQTKKLFIFTVNDKFKIDINMTNRPGRIYYLLEYKGLECEFIRGYCQDNLTNKKYVESVAKISILFWSFNFDMLKAIVEEMNRYDESPIDAVKFLNAKPESQNNAYYDVQLFVDGVKPAGTLIDSSVHINPLLTPTVTLEFYPDKKKTDEEDDDDGSRDYTTYEFSIADMQSIDAKSGEYVYVKNNTKMILKRQQEKEFNFADGYSKLVTM